MRTALHCNPPITSMGAISVKRTIISLGILGTFMTFGIVVTASAEETKKDKAEFIGCTDEARLAMRKLARAVKHAKSYSDNANVSMKMEAGQAMDSPMSFIFVKPNRFRMRTQMNEVNSDGKQLTVFLKHNQRYIVKPLKSDVAKQVARYSTGMWLDFGIGQLFLSDSPEQYLAERLTDLEIDGSESIDGERCTILDGFMKTSEPSPFKGDIQARLWLRESDFMIRKFEIKVEPDTEEEGGEENQALSMITNFTVTYDIIEIAVNEIGRASCRERV